jgi:carbonic anhydrase/acetyltransferase-like protein (isoleucine patch superfamily)
MTRSVAAMMVFVVGSGICGSALVAQVTPIGGEVVVTSESEDNFWWPQTAMGADGAFVVVWTDREARVVRGQRFTRSGRPVGGGFVTSDLGTYKEIPAVAMTPGGEFIVTWGLAQGVYAQRFDRDAAALSDGFLVTRDGYYGQDVTMAADGAFVVAWATYRRGAFAQRFDSDGIPRGAEITLSAGPYSPVLATTPGGGFVSALLVEDASRRLDVVGQRIDASGAPGSPFKVNTVTSESQSNASLSVAPDGRFVVAWSSVRQDGDSDGVFGQRFAPDGEREGGEFQINTRTIGRQFAPAVAMTGDGGFVAVWGDGPVGLEQRVVAQVFDAGGLRVGNEVTLGENQSDAEPSIAVTVDGSGVAIWAGRSADGRRDLHLRRFRFSTTGAGSDADGDGILFLLDNCPTVPNPDQADAQGDGHGDACVAPDVFLPDDLSLGANPIVGTGTSFDARIAIGDDAVIGELVVVRQAVRAGNRLRIGDLTVIGRRAVLGDDVTLGFASLVDAVVTIGDGVTLGDGAKVRRDAVIENGVTIDRDAIVFAGARIGAGATVEEGARVGRRAIVLPGALVPAGTSVSPGATFP